MAARRSLVFATYGGREGYLGKMAEAAEGTGEKE